MLLRTLHLQTAGAALAALLLAGCAGAPMQPVPPKDAAPFVRTDLVTGEPPARGSVLQEGDEAAYRYGLTLRGTERGVQAQADARVAGLKTNLKRLSEVTGVTLSREATPETYRLLEIYYASLARTTHHMKQTFLRPRPVEVYPEDKGCLPEQRLSKGSYPSGHSARSWAAALAVATLLPQQAERILRAGYELGESRWICGPHWRSDVEAGRIAATSVLTRLLAEESFLVQLRRAQAEIKAQTVK